MRCRKTTESLAFRCVSQAKYPLYHQIKTLIDFWCKRGLNSKSLIQLLEILPLKQYATSTQPYFSSIFGFKRKMRCHKTTESLAFRCVSQAKYPSYYQIKTLIDFWCKRGLNSKSLIQLLEILPSKQYATSTWPYFSSIFGFKRKMRYHKTTESLAFRCVSQAKYPSYPIPP